MERKQTVTLTVLLIFLSECSWNQSYMIASYIEFQYSPLLNSEEMNYYCKDQNHLSASGTSSFKCMVVLMLHKT